MVSDIRPASAPAPEEAHDQLPYPPWLRVYWRKAHPEVDWYRTVAYPLILKEIGGWMRRHQDLPVQGVPKIRVIVVDGGTNAIGSLTIPITAP